MTTDDLQKRAEAAKWLSDLLAQIAEDPRREIYARGDHRNPECCFPEKAITQSLTEPGTYTIKEPPTRNTATPEMKQMLALADKEYQWVAVDEDGEVIIFVKKPEIEGRCHYVEGAQRILPLIVDLPPGDWKYSAFSRDMLADDPSI